MFVVRSLKMAGNRKTCYFTSLNLFPVFTIKVHTQTKKYTLHATALRLNKDSLKRLRQSLTHY